MSTLVRTRTVIAGGHSINAAIFRKAWHTTVMPKRSSKKSKQTDISQLARAIVEEVTGESLAKHALPKDHPKNQHAKRTPLRSPLASLRKKGGTARPKKLTPEQRKVIAQKAARAQWCKPHEPSLLFASKVTS